MPESTVHGFVADKFSSVRDAFEANLASAADVGASCCVTLEGETVVDLWGGFADEAKTRPWERNTIVNVYSTTKTMTALTALLLADRGELDFDAPVARYWPEFAANGKERIKVSHLMSHSSGLSGWKAAAQNGRSLRLGEDDVAPRRAGAAVGAGDGVRISRGHLRVSDGRSGAPDHRKVSRNRVPRGNRGAVGRRLPHRPARLRGFPRRRDHSMACAADARPSLVFSEIQELTFMNMPFDVATTTRTRAWRAAEIPAVNGHGNARSIAEIHCILANGGVARGSDSCLRRAAAKRWNSRSKDPTW